MSVPFYYQGGNLFSSTLKQTQHAVRQKHSKRFAGRKAKETRMSDGRTFEVVVTVPPAAQSLAARRRHELLVLGKTFEER